jgi:hypothetical protein
VRLLPIFGCLLVSAFASAQSCSTTPCVHGETGTCHLAATCNQADVQACVTAAAAGSTGVTTPNAFGGDGVYVPAGSCSWSSPVSWTNKNINVVASAPTIIPSGNAFVVNVSNAGATAAAFRISGFNFTGAPSGDVLNINNSNPNLTSWAGFFRFDHNVMTFTSSGNVIIVYGPVWGLIDHVTVSTPSNFLEQSDFLNSEYNQFQAGNYSELMGEYSGRILPEALGTENAIYVEDSTFTCTGNYSGALSDSESGGQRMVWRHNTSTGACFHYAHWTRGSEWDGHKYEMYDNTYNGAGASGYPMRFGSGTGVIFNNTIYGYADPTVHVDETRGSGGESTNPPYYDCQGSRALDGNAGDPNAPGWPCAGQIGTGCTAGSCTRSTMNNIPLLLWNNGAQPGCSTGGTCTNSVTVDVDGGMGSGNTATRAMTNYIKSTPHSVPGALNGAVDYCQGATMPATCGIYTNSYTPYTYPHPLAGSTVTLPPPVIHGTLAPQ